MQTTLFYLAQGYAPGAPSQQAEQIDAAVAERHPCRRCGGQTYYDGFHNQDSYIAFIVCRVCGYRVEF